MPTAIAIHQVPGKPGKVWYPLDKIQVPDQKPSADQVCFFSAFTISFQLRCLLSAYNRSLHVQTALTISQSGDNQNPLNLTQPPRPLHPPTSLPRNQFRNSSPRRRHRHRNLNRRLPLRQILASQARDPEPRQWMGRLSHWPRSTGRLRDPRRHKNKPYWHTTGIRDY